jgi:hypothetical protein
MKWVSIAALFSAILWRPSAGYELLLQFAVCVGAILVIGQSYRVDKFRWGIVFIVVALLFNPLAPPAMSRSLFLWLATICLALFATSLFALKTQPRLSIASITDRTPGSQSL